MKPNIKTFRAAVSKKVRNLPWSKLGFRAKKSHQVYELSAEPSDCGKDDVSIVQAVLEVTPQASVDSIESVALAEDIPLPPSDDEWCMTDAELFPGFEFDDTHDGGEDLTDAELFHGFDYDDTRDAGEDLTDAGLFSDFDFDPSHDNLEAGEQQEEAALSTGPDQDTDDTLPDSSSLCFADRDAIWQSQQAERERRYLRFNGEDETDYTRGPVRMINADDGTDNVATLLMNLGLSRKIQLSISFQREYSKNVRIFKQKDEAAEIFINKLKNKLRPVKTAIKALEPEGSVAARNFDDMSSWLGPIEPVGELQILKAELDKLELLLKNTIAMRENMVIEQRNQADHLMMLRADVDAILEEAFVNAQLMAPEECRADTPIEPMQIETEWEILEQQMTSDNWSDCGPDGNDELAEEAFKAHDDDALSYQHSQTSDPTPQTAEEKAIDALHDEFSTAEYELRQAQSAFDNRDDTRKAEINRNSFLYEQSGGQEGFSPDQFDLHMLKLFQDLTRTLIECEERYERAKRAAHEAGLNFIADEDQASCFGDEDGAYPLSEEKYWAGTVDRNAIEGWQSDIPGDGTALTADEQGGDFPETDEWDGEEVDISDSFSAIGYGRDGPRIQRWREQCGW